MKDGIDILTFDVKYNDICICSMLFKTASVVLKCNILSVYQESLTAPNTAIVSVSADDFQLFNGVFWQESIQYNVFSAVFFPVKQNVSGILKPII